jgi:hypothetical protein
MAKRQLRGLCYNCDDKYFLGHKCLEQKKFITNSENVSNEDVDAPHAKEPPQANDQTLPSDPPEAKPLISLNALTSFSIPQFLKLIGCIKHSVIARFASPLLSCREGLFPFPYADLSSLFDDPEPKVYIFPHILPLSTMKDAYTLVAPLQPAYIGIFARK